MTAVSIDSRKYDGEAHHVAALLQHHDFDGAQRALAADGHLQPHELHKFMQQLKTACSPNGSLLPDITITDDKSGIKIALKPDAGSEPKTVFERSADELAKAKDKIPMTGELLNLTAEQTKAILDQQQQERKEHGGKSHMFGDIAVSMGFATPEQVNKALQKQDRLKAEQSADDLLRSMPVQQGEGYVQMLQRTRPEMDWAHVHENAEALKHKNHNRNVLREGEQLPAAGLAHPGAEKRKLTTEFYEENRKKTGSVHATHRGQPLADIPIT